MTTERTTTTLHTNDDLGMSNIKKEPEQMHYYLSLIPDETLVEIVLWLPNVKDCVRWSQTCHRLHRVIQQDKSVLTKLVQTRKIPFHQRTSTFEQLAWYERVKECGLFKEHRIGFSMASTEIEDDDDSGMSNDENNDDDVFDPTTICGSMKRIAYVQQLLQEFPRMQVIVDAHCGSSGPMMISRRISKDRGMVVIDELTKNNRGAGRQNGLLSSWWERRNISAHSNTPPISSRELTGRMTLHAWGRQVSDHAASGNSIHPHATLARIGMGWAELYLGLDDMELPERPDFYEGFDPSSNEVDLNRDDPLEDDDDDQPMNIQHHILRVRLVNDDDDE